MEGADREDTQFEINTEKVLFSRVYSVVVPLGDRKVVRLFFHTFRNLSVLHNRGIHAPNGRTFPLRKMDGFLNLRKKKKKKSANLFVGTYGECCTRRWLMIGWYARLEKYRIRVVSSGVVSTVLIDFTALHFTDRNFTYENCTVTY